MEESYQLYHNTSRYVKHICPGSVQIKRSWDHVGICLRKDLYSYALICLFVLQAFVMFNMLGPPKESNNLIINHPSALYLCQCVLFSTTDKANA